jgi:hypothetical protein
MPAGVDRWLLAMLMLALEGEKLITILLFFFAYRPGTSFLG